MSFEMYKLVNQQCAAHSGLPPPHSHTHTHIHQIPDMSEVVKSKHVFKLFTILMAALTVIHGDC